MVRDYDHSSRGVGIVKRRTFMTTVGSAATIGSMAGCLGGGGGQDGNGTQSPTSRSDTVENEAGVPVGTTRERIEELAEEEGGKFVIYSSVDKGPMSEYFDLFKEKYSFASIEHITGGGGDTMSRFVSEYQTNNVAADVYWSGVNHTMVASDEDMYMDINADIVPEMSDIPAEYKPANDWVALSQLPGGFLYNTDHVSQDDISSPADIVSKDLFSGGTLGWSATPLWEFLKWQRANWGDQFFQDLSDQSPRYKDSVGGLTKDVASGELYATWAYAHMLRIVPDAPVDIWVPSDPNAYPITVTAAGVNNKAQHPNTALLWLNHMLTVDLQKYMGGTKYVPFRQGAEYTGVEGVLPPTRGGGWDWEVADATAVDHESQSEFWKSSQGLNI